MAIKEMPNDTYIPFSNHGSRLSIRILALLSDDLSCVNFFCISVCSFSICSFDVFFYDLVRLSLSIMKE